MPAIIPVSFRESFEPKLSFRCEFVVVVEEADDDVNVLFGDLLLISIFDDNGGRSGLFDADDVSFTVAKRKVLKI